MLTRVKLGLAPGDIALLSVGDLNENKNHRVLVEAIAKLPANYRLFIAGEGPLREALEDEARSFGVGDRITLLGFRNDVTALLKACDIFCFPSKREGLPVSLIEAMACGIPCLASSARGCADVLGDLSGACIVYGGPKEWAQQIINMTSNPNFSTRLANISRFDFQIIIKQMEQIYA